MSQIRFTDSKVKGGLCRLHSIEMCLEMLLCRYAAPVHSDQFSQINPHDTQAHIFATRNLISSSRSPLLDNCRAGHRSYSVLLGLVSPSVTRLSGAGIDDTLPWPDNPLYCCPFYNSLDAEPTHAMRPNT